MISVQEAIARFRRDVTLSTLLKAALAAGAGAVLQCYFERQQCGELPSI